MLTGPLGEHLVHPTNPTNLAPIDRRGQRTIVPNKTAGATIMAQRFSAWNAKVHAAVGRRGVGIDQIIRRRVGGGAKDLLLGLRKVLGTHMHPSLTLPGCEAMYELLPLRISTLVATSVDNSVDTSGGTSEVISGGVSST